MWSDKTLIFLYLNVAIFIRTYLIETYKISDKSMEPSLPVGSVVVANKFIFSKYLFDWEKNLLPIREPKRGEIIAFRYPDKPDNLFIKRVIAIPGDKVVIKSKSVYLNGKKLNENYVQFEDSRVYPNSFLLEEKFRYRDHMPSVEVTNNYYFVLGDNRDLSYDSRFWGLVAKNFVKSKIIFQLF